MFPKINSRMLRLERDNDGSNQRNIEVSISNPDPSNAFKNFTNRP